MPCSTATPAHLELLTLLSMQRQWSTAAQAAVEQARAEYRDFGHGLTKETAARAIARLFECPANPNLTEEEHATLNESLADC